MKIFRTKSFNVFVQENCRSQKLKTGGIPLLADYVKEYASQWRQLTEAEKDVYRLRAQEINKEGLKKSLQMLESPPYKPNRYSSYNQFIKENFKSVKYDNSRDAIKQCSAKWRLLSAADRQVYEDKIADIKAQPKVLVLQKNNLMALYKLAGAKSRWHIYTRTNFKKVAQQLGTASFKPVIQELSRNWQKLTQDQRNHYLRSLPELSLPQQTMNRLLTLYGRREVKRSIYQLHHRKLPQNQHTYHRFVRQRCEHYRNIGASFPQGGTLKQIAQDWREYKKQESHG